MKSASGIAATGAAFVADDKFAALVLEDWRDRYEANLESQKAEKNL